jgi:CubicO group peptidase (beta-lactamase class C family)
MDSARAQPLRPDTMMWTASCTKLMTSISCMQLVERGLVSLDEPVYKHIPELGSFTVIKKIEQDGTPVEVKHKSPITLRKLLTHTSGLAYDTMHPKALAWLKYHKKPLGSSGKILERFNVPLVFEPGESWTYGSGLDYAGLLVERITGLSLEEYMRQNLWKPLGVTDMTFSLERHPKLAARRADMSLRDDFGKLSSTEKIFNVDGKGREWEDCFGGAGCWTSAEAYSKIIHGLLTSDKTEKLLSKESLKEFFKPQLNTACAAKMNSVLNAEAVSAVLRAIRRMLTGLPTVQQCHGPNTHRYGEEPRTGRRCCHEGSARWYESRNHALEWLAKPLLGKTSKLQHSPFADYFIVGRSSNWDMRLLRYTSSPNG